ncbi:hypothetical protein [Arenibacter sp. S6351L]|uniref:hypothetical protein n=1 Tax=Arenibacter sp. S6351L TaxID=2926407 RepID=UPI001FF18613|nr:hypothetical protein [Arenibacter sp. S6351L]MCK0136076.1 hypothetical protein [Arenibacter sp. S6351L]
MIQKTKIRGFCLSFALFFATAFVNLLNAQQTGYFEAPYSREYEDIMANRMKIGIDTFLTNYTKQVVRGRENLWDRNFSSWEAYEASISSNREHLRKIIGIDKPRSLPDLNVKSSPGNGTMISETEKCIIYEIEWPVKDGLVSEGLLLVPKEGAKTSIVVVPDADELAESYAGMVPGKEALALRLAEGGAQVIIPILINRQTELSGSDSLTSHAPWMGEGETASIWTNETHREWIHRQSYMMGQHIIGLEAEKVMSAIDWFKETQPDLNVGIMGYGEGGLLALYTAALDIRIDVAWVSGYFGPREELWQEPVYRNVWGLLREFGDAEVASLIAPRKLVIEQSPVPNVKEPLTPKNGQVDHALPGRLETPSNKEVRREFDRLKEIFPKSGKVQPDFFLTSVKDYHGSEQAISRFSKYLGMDTPSKIETQIQLKDLRPGFSSQHRQSKVFHNMQEYIQDMIPGAERNRYAFLKGDTSSPENWEKDMEVYIKKFYSELVGEIDVPLLPLNPRIRQVYDEPGWKGYEVILDVWEGVFSWGILAVPNDIEQGEQRPVVVLQHGIRGLPSTAIESKSYKGVVPALANRGFVVFSPHNPYQFTIRKANAIKATAFSVIIPQHKQILKFLGSLDYVDADRIALYGKSFGGRTALRVPIVLKEYRAVISSAYFNDWVRKTVSTEYRNSFFFENSGGIYEWNMGNTFTHAEMASVICPRPFMVESGYFDGVAAHESVAYEFAKVKRLYGRLGIGKLAELEFFWGGHDINGEGTFKFLHEHLNWPEPKNPTKEQQVKK